MHSHDDRLPCASERCATYSTIPRKLIDARGRHGAQQDVTRQDLQIAKELLPLIARPHRPILRTPPRPANPPPSEQCPTAATATTDLSAAPHTPGAPHRLADSRTTHDWPARLHELAAYPRHLEMACTARRWRRPASVVCLLLGPLLPPTCLRDRRDRPSYPCIYGISPVASRPWRSGQKSRTDGRSRQKSPDSDTWARQDSNLGPIDYESTALTN
jgi:hypothetical protein